MKKLKLFAIFIIPLLMLLIFNVLLATQAASPVQAKVGSVMPESKPYAGSVISDVEALANPITGLVISHSTPVDLNEPVFFTATVTGGTEPIFYSWNFGDGSATVIAEPPESNFISYTYSITGNYTVILTAANFSSTPIMTTSIVISATDLPEPPPPNVSFTYSEPAIVGEPVVFTATVISGTQPIFYRWNFGDKTGEFSPTPPTAITISHTYDLSSEYTVILSATNFSPTPLGTASDNIIVEDPLPSPPSGPPLQSVFLPLLLTHPQADLVCKYTLDPPTVGAGDNVLITVQIKNQGKVEADGFWVDAYFNPIEPPAEDNLGPWQDACGGKSSCPTGIAWSISNNPVSPGGSINLVSINDDEDPNTHGYNPAYTVWDGHLPDPFTSMFIYVDSINNNDGKGDGSVSESLESNNECRLVESLESATNEHVPSRRSPGTLPVR
ncbi:MAG: PKD domain-containing protein [Anaerolineae bacterium]|nr:PKD domain-containing protein [Anaerolineae bacterium]